MARRRPAAPHPLAALLALLLPAAAVAHEGASLPYGSFLGGLLHPVLGPDHFLAMVSVGILSAQIGGRAIWTVPATFVGVMFLGGIYGWLGLPLASIEAGIAFSVLTLGAAIAAERRIPVAVAMLFVGSFAVFHGYAHGAEMPDVATPVTYALGFVSGTAGLHLAGVVIGDIARHYASGKLLLRAAGGVIAAFGVYFMLAATGTV